MTSRKPPSPKRKTPSYKGLKPASSSASKAAKGSSRKTGTKPEVLLQETLRECGLDFEVDAADLPGRPDIVFRKEKVAVFVDGDFWHGRRLEERISKLTLGHNPDYWTQKIRANVRRDRRISRVLRSDGWTVLRVWESQALWHASYEGRRVARHVLCRRASLG